MSLQNFTIFHLNFQCPLFNKSSTQHMTLNNNCMICFSSDFKNGRSPILIATDVASRGLGMSSTDAIFYSFKKIKAGCSSIWLSLHLLSRLLFYAMFWIRPVCTFLRHSLCPINDILVQLIW